MIYFLINILKKKFHMKKKKYIYNMLILMQEQKEILHFFINGLYFHKKHSTYWNLI